MKKGKFVILLLTCTTLAPLCLVRAQQPSQADSCYTYVEGVARLYNREDRAESDVMTSIATLAQSGLECYNYEPNTKTAWLLNNHANALEHLDRYEEVQTLTDLFFERFFDAADEEHKGRWHMRALYLDLRAGDYGGATDDYKEALRYADALPLAQQAGLRNNGFVLEFRRERFEEAAGEATAGIALLDSTAKTRDEAVEFARLLQNRGEARLAAFKNDSTSLLLDPARRDLHASIALRDSLSITERQAEAYVSLGEIYDALGDGQAGRGYMGTGLRLAREGGNPRGEIFALWRMGRMSRRGELLSLGSQQLQEALRLSEESGVGEFKLFIQLELARLFEDKGAWRRAENLYRAIVETPDDARYRSRLFDTAKARDEAERRRVAMRMHLAEATTSWLRMGLLGSLLVIALMAGAFAWHWKRNARLQRRFALLKNGAPEEDNLFDRRRRYAYRVLERPAEVAIVLGETDLSVLLVAGLADRTQLYACVCALEKAIEDRVIDPENMRRYLHHHFTKKGWDWPESLDTWKEHFRERPI